MSQIEIPMLRAAAAYANRLLSAASKFGDSRYLFHRRVNWSYKFSNVFYQAEADAFLHAPESYLAGNHDSEPRLEDIWGLRLSTRQTVLVLMKVMAHWLFRVAGALTATRSALYSAKVYRKGYVDDIELVFPAAQPSVLRAIHPFPINLGRQWRYLKYLREKRYPFKLDGYPYCLVDLIKFLTSRTLRSQMRLEARAQIRHAFGVARSGVHTVQISDEFDIGSLDFCRALRRCGLKVVNSAHGVGKYLPVHAYEEFHVITDRQAQYYRAIYTCRYIKRVLNDKVAEQVSLPVENTTSGISLVFLSQVFNGVSEIVFRNERKTVQRLSEEFEASSAIRLLYRPHPNCHQPVIPKGFELLKELNAVNDRHGTIFVSLYSTCQIDPAFKGEKILVRGELIYPEIVFDDSERVIDLDGLCMYIRLEEKKLESPPYLHSDYKS